MDVRWGVIERVDPDLEPFLANERGHCLMVLKALGYFKPGARGPRALQTRSEVCGFPSLFSTDILDESRRARQRRRSALWLHGLRGHSPSAE